MMKPIYKCLAFFLALSLSMAFVSCAKDMDRADSGEITDGESSVAFELSGLPLQSALTRTSGDAIREVDNLYILFYTKGQSGNEADYELAYAFTTDTGCENDVFSKELRITGKEYVGRVNEGEAPGDSEFNPHDNEWDGVAESNTRRVTTSEVQVKRGWYAVYVVANVKGFSSGDFSRADIGTVGKLRDYQLTWNGENVKENNAMFGYFTQKGAQNGTPQNGTQGHDVINTQAPLVKIAEKALTLHAWVKRAVSKVTIAFDGTQLYDGVRVYIKNVRIHDIPLNCKLGAANSPASDGELIKDSEKLTYTAAAGATVSTRISKREPYFPEFEGLADDDDDVSDWKKKIHSETHEALYFFENLQGKSTGEADANGSWKQQTDSNSNGIPDDRDNGIDKDTKKFGTYVEVEAYYQNDNFGTRSEGDIKYRFMLGKNTTDDFNAERNNHYRLTLRFKHNANDVDWHIEYNEKEIEIEDTIYVSYEYNTPTILPVRFVDKVVTDLSVTINSSNWYPDDNSINRYKGTTVNPTGLATGFLSLTYDNNPRISAGETFNVNDAARVTTYWNNQSNNTTRNYVRGGNKVTWTDLDDYGYGVTSRTNNDGKTVFEANIPLFTRPLIIYKWTSWTGANPYYTSTRSAEITLSGTVGGAPYTKKIKVIQVPRIENPSGIYRRNDNDEEFNVVCMARSGEMYNSPISFKEFNSVGGWRATIYLSSDGNGNQKDWFTLTAGQQRAATVDAFIQGDPNTPIKFKYKPNGTIGKNEVRCGVIKVEYNNYSCTHYIFVRQGYAPMQLESGKVYWHTFNLYSGSAEAMHPCEAGSFFVRGHWAPAILDSNTAGYGEEVNSLLALTNAAGTTTGNVTIPIKNSDYKRQAFPTTNRTFSGNSAAYNPWNSGRVPTLAEWSTLKDERSNATIDKGFGVLYGDGVKETLSNPDNVWGCLHANVGADGKAARGMRGAFVYNASDGRNIFLPIGASGFGRRKVGYTNGASTGVHGGGRLQYSFSDSYWSDPYLSNTNTPSRPLLYNLPTNEGAIYWAQDEIHNMTGSTHAYDNGWDINYKTYDFDFMEAIDKNLTAGSNRYSACYIRLVQTEAPQ